LSQEVEEEVTPRELITHFRMMAHQYFPYLSPYVYSLVPVERPGLGTMAVDMQGRMYFDPDFAQSITLNEGAYVVLHEAVHLILRHCHRAESIIGQNPTAQDRRGYNIAGDLVGWEFLEAIAHHAPEGGVTFDALKKDYPELQRNMLPGEIYAILARKPEPQPEQPKPPKGDQPSDEPPGTEEQDDGQRPPGDDEAGTETEGPGGDGPGKDKQPTDQGGGGGQPEDQVGDDGYKLTGGGSAADGQPRDYEEDPNPNWDAFIEDQLLDAVEKKIEEHENGRGTVPSNLKQTIKAKLRPQPNPWDQLRATVGKAIANPRGKPDFTYQKVNRRQFAVPNTPRLKGARTYAPKAAVVIDTSGSMTSACLAKAVVVVKQGLQAIGEVPVITCDARVSGDRVLKNVHEDFEFVGGGGTDMRIPIDYAEKKYKPDVIVLVTDCDTPWPSDPTKAQLIVAATQDGRVPNWAIKVRIPDSPEKKEL
jgi:predicted metal-dependent peptidase